MTEQSQNYAANNESASLSALTKIDSVPAVLRLNYDEVKTAISAYLEKYRNVIITEDGVKAGKELIAEINVTRKELDKRRKEAIESASEPIKLFDAQMRELIAMHDELKEAIRSQTDKFDEEQKIKAAQLIEQALNSAWDELVVAPEFRKATASDLALLTSLTGKGNLTTKVVSEIKQRAQDNKNLQIQTDFRLKDLELQSYKAGLAAPLTRAHIEPFLFVGDSEYNAKLSALIGNEIEREKRAVEAHRAKIEAEMRAKQEAENNAERLRLAKIEDEQRAEAKRLADLAAEQEYLRHSAETLERQMAEHPDVFDNSDLGFPEECAGAFDDEDFGASVDEYFENNDGYEIEEDGEETLTASSVITLAFQVKESANTDEINRRIMAALESCNLGQFVNQIQTTIIPF